MLKEDLQENPVAFRRHPAVPGPGRDSSLIKEFDNLFLCETLRFCAFVAVFFLLLCFGSHDIVVGFPGTQDQNQHSGLFFLKNLTFLIKLRSAHATLILSIL